MNEQPSLSNQSMDDEPSLKELLSKVMELYRYLFQYWILIVFIGVFGAVLGLIYAFSKVPLYKAEYSFALEDERPGGLSGALGLASQFGLSVEGSGGGAFTGDNLMELMKSRSLVEKALLSPINVNGKRQSLIEYYIDFTGLREKWAKQPELSQLKYEINADPASFTRNQNKVLVSIHQAIVNSFLSVAKVDKKLSIIKVEVKSINELFAKEFTEALVGRVSSFYIETKTKKSIQNVAILQHQTDSIRAQLNRAIVGVAQSTDNTINLNAARQVLRAPSQRRQIDVQANTAILTELVKNLELSKLSLRRETPLIQTIDKPVFPLPMESYSKVKSVVIGGFLGGFLIISYLLIRRLINTLV